jgi:xylulokinase
MNRGILVYDIGTTSVKSAVFDLSGRPAGFVSAPYKTEFPRPGWAQQDPEQFWLAAVKGTRELLALPELASAEIVVVGLAGHMNGCLPVDAGGNPTYPELIHADSRSGVQSARIRDLLGRDFLYRETANRTDEHLSLPKILWLKDEGGTAFERTAWFLNAKDYLRFKLTGILGWTDFSDASLTGAFNLEKRDWSWEIIDALDLPRERFPAAGSSIEGGGRVSKDAAAVLGLKEGIPVSLGGGDAACATRGSGITGGESGGGQAYISLGSSAWASRLFPAPVLDPGRRMQNFFDLDGRSCNVCGTLQSAGIAVDWALRLLLGAEADSADYRRVEGDLEAVPPGSDGVIFLPYLMGERTPHWDASARGLFIGLSLSAGPQTLLRSVYEGIAFGLKEIIDIYGDLSMAPDSLVLLGGGIRSDFWRRIICDTIGKPMLIHPFPTHAISLGAAMAAGVSVGLWPNLEEAPWTGALAGERLLPDAEKNAVYTRYSALYREIYGRVKPVFDGLAEIKE